MKYNIICKDSDESRKVKDQLIQKFGVSHLDEENPDICFTVGGDGTYLCAVHRYIEKLDHILFININTGNLGFYSNIDVSDLEKLDDIIKTQGDFVYHDLLSFQINEGVTHYAVNEIAIYGVPEALKTEIYVDKVKLEDFTGTGLVVSTPTGSTGLNKSLSGAIIDEKLKTLQLTEVAGIKNSIFKSIGNSLVLDSTRTIEIVLKEANEGICVSYDNKALYHQDLKTIKIEYSDKKVKDLKYIKKDFFERVQKSFL